jgi:uncharacterized protein (TIGR01244 family)
LRLLISQNADISGMYLRALPIATTHATRDDGATYRALAISLEMAACPMSQFRRVTDTLTVSPQIVEADLARAAAEGFALVINNRPDGEEPGQPTAATLETAALALGLNYLHVPVRGGPGPEQVEAVRTAIESAGGPVLAFCRSGTRSIVTWALGQALAGDTDRETLVDQGAAAGYDLSGVLPR